MSKPLRLLVDMDGVLCDFETVLLDNYRSRFPDEPFIPKSDRKLFYAQEEYARIKPELKDNVSTIVNSPGFFRHLPPLPNAIKAVHWLEEIPDVSTWICTSPLGAFHNCVLEKYQWVEQHLGFRWTKKVIMCKDKTLISADYLIDDRPTIKGEEEMNPKFGQHILFTQPYNLSVETQWRLDCWPNSPQKLTEFIRLLQQGVQ
jgi:5'-nucleotidase